MQKAYERAEALLQEVAAAHGVTVEAMRSPVRLKTLVAARGRFAYRARYELQLSLNEIGMLLSRDHSTVMTAIAAQEGAQTQAQMRRDWGPERLTALDKNVLRLLAEGKVGKEIQASMHLTETGLRNTCTRIATLLGTNTRTSSVVKALKLGLLKLEEIDV